MLVAALAIVNREPGQALTGAAISGVALCEGCLQHADEKWNQYRKSATPEAAGLMKAILQVV